MKKLLLYLLLVAAVSIHARPSTCPCKCDSCMCLQCLITRARNSSIYQGPPPTIINNVHIHCNCPCHSGKNDSSIGRESVNSSEESSEISSKFSRLKSLIIPYFVSKTNLSSRNASGQMKEIEDLQTTYEASSKTSFTESHADFSEGKTEPYLLYSFVKSVTEVPEPSDEEESQSPIIEAENGHSATEVSTNASTSSTPTLESIFHKEKTTELGTDDPTTEAATELPVPEETTSVTETPISELPTSVHKVEISTYITETPEITTTDPEICLSCEELKKEYLALKEKLKRERETDSSIQSSTFLPITTL